MNLQSLPERRVTDGRLDPRAASAEDCPPARSVGAAAYNIGSKIHTMSNPVAELTEIKSSRRTEIAGSQILPTPHPAEEVAQLRKRFAVAL